MFALIVAATVILSGIDPIVFTNQLMLGSYVPMVILVLLFIFVIAEENVLAILYLVTRSKGGNSNHLHFTVFSVIYLGILVAAYGKKSGLLDVEVQFFDPYGLLAISSVVAIFTFSLKKDALPKAISFGQWKTLLLIAGTLVWAFLSLTMAAGYDAVYEAFHYFIVYAHLAFGTLFFLYIIINFVNPLSKGFQIYKIAYKERNFPYSTARLGGLAAVAAFFFLSNNEPLRLIQAGRYNILGTQAEQNNAFGLATRYFEEGAIFGHDNHYSNYKLGYQALKKEELKEANYFFGRAKNRYPSPQAYVNHAGTYAKLSQATLAQVALESGLETFPGNEQIHNNLGLTFMEQGNREKALQSFQSAQSQGEWNQATLVNYWRIAEPNESIEQAEDTYQKGNLPAKTNILSKLLAADQTKFLDLDTAMISDNHYPLHRIPYLINASWYFQDTLINSYFETPLNAPISESMLRESQLAMILNEYAAGEVNTSILKIAQMVESASTFDRPSYLNVKGLMLLQHQAPELAISAFEEAALLNAPEAPIHLLAALLESGEFAAANLQLNKMIAEDSVYLPLRAELNWLDTKLIKPTPSQVYYQHRSFDPDAIKTSLEQMDPEYLRSFWKKISHELLEDRDFDRLNNLQKVFESYLPKEALIEAASIKAILTDQPIPLSNHVLYLATQKPSKEEKISTLYKMATQNALNEPLTTAAVILLDKEDPERAYNALLESININQSNVALHKLFVLQAVDLALFDYADSGLEKLRGFMDPADFASFSKSVDKRKAQIEADSW